MLSAPIKRTTLYWVAAALVVQVICALFFVVELLTEVFGLRTWAVAWEIREALQVGASVGLVLGTVTGAVLLRQTLRRIVSVEQQVRVASGAFFEVMDQCFEDWRLTRSEREVALFAVRGYSNGEIAKIRCKSEATIKTQMNAVFRKADVSGRAQLLSQFVDLLIESGQATKEAAAHATATPEAASRAPSPDTPGGEAERRAPGKARGGMSAEGVGTTPGAAGKQGAGRQANGAAQAASGGAADGAGHKAGAREPAAGARSRAPSHLGDGHLRH